MCIIFEMAAAGSAACYSKNGSLHEGKEGTEMKKHFLLSAAVAAAVAVTGMGSMAVMAEDSTEATLETSAEAAETETVETVAAETLAADEEEVIDFSAYSDDEIAELLKEINQEVVDRRLEKSAKLEPGVYTVGVDIPAGSYTYSVTVVADDDADDDDDRYTVDFDDADDVDDRDDADDVDDTDDQDDVDDKDDVDEADDRNDADDSDDAYDRWKADWENFDWEHFNWDEFKSNLEAEDILPHGNHGTLIVKNDDDLTPNYMSAVNSEKEFSAHLDLVEGDKLYIPFDGTLTIRTGVVFE